MFEVYLMKPNGETVKCEITEDGAVIEEPSSSKINQENLKKGVFNIEIENIEYFLSKPTFKKPEKVEIQQSSLLAYKALYALDAQFVGTPHYMGYAFYWHPAYKYPLREFANSRQLKWVHDEFLKAGLEVDGTSDAHDEIVRRAKIKSR